MNENLIEAQYNVTKKSKFKKFYDDNKFKIFLIVFFLIVFITSISFYLTTKENKRLLLADKYITAQIYLNNGDIEKAKEIYKNIIFANDKTYSVLSLNLIISENLFVENDEVINLFNYVLEKNKLDIEDKNLLIFKKALFQSNFSTETDLLETSKPLINSKSIWKPHILLLLADYFFSKKEILKAKEFYIQVLSTKDLHNDLYSRARSQLMYIKNE